MSQLNLCLNVKNELPCVKMKWAVRLLMKLKKDIQKNYQKDLIDIITKPDDEANTNFTLTSGIPKREPTASCKCVVSNPDMKGIIINILPKTSITNMLLNR